MTDHLSPMITLHGGGCPTQDDADLAQQIYHCIQKHGYFCLVDHGIPRHLSAKVAQQSLKFFEQSVEDKGLVHYRASTGSKNDGNYYGWQPPFVSQWSATVAKALQPHSAMTHQDDNLESFNIGYDHYRQAQHDTIPRPMSAGLLPASRLEDMSPRDPGFVWRGTVHLSNFQADILRYYEACLALSRRLLALIAVALGAPSDEFDRSLTCPQADLSLNYYKCDPSESVLAGIGVHTDLKALTLLWQDKPGLQVRRPDGHWEHVPVVDGALVVTIGDSLMHVTNGSLESTAHRVEISNADSPRLSIAFFAGFDANASTVTIPTCVRPDEVAKYPTTTFGDVVLPFRPFSPPYLCS